MNFEEWFDQQFFLQFGSGKNVRRSQSSMCYQIKPGDLVEFAKTVWEAGYNNAK